MIRSFLDRLRALLRAAPPEPPPLPLSGAAWAMPQEAARREEAAHWAYRMILLREPESAEALRYLMDSGPTPRQMRDVLLLSPEVRAQHGFPVVLSLDVNEPPQPVEVHVEASHRDALFARVQAVWHGLGEQQPHWSVVTDEAFRPDRIDQALDRFYATGEGNIDTLLRTLARNGIDPASLATCMDFGCGVGRLSVPLARRFAQVHAVDVSASHLALAREAFAQRGCANIATHHLRRMDDMASLPDVDLVYSVIVLQHNPPPVMRALLDGLLRHVRPGGAAVIQVPTYLPGGYRFALGDYLAAGTTDMEMHALPQSEVFAAARDAAMDVLEVLDDAWTGYGVGSRSNTFVIRRPA